MKDSPEIVRAPAPWTLKATIYMIPFIISAEAAAAVPTELLYHATESSSSFSSFAPLGGLSMIQILRYSDTPVGPYDELVITPGSFAYEKDGKRMTAVRATCLYVSQRDTCLNGRLNWNMPKHLASFTFKTTSDGSTQITVTPYNHSGKSADRPFFSSIFKTVPCIPSFPISTKLASYVGYDLSCVQPPLPSGADAAEAGTSQWSKVLPSISSRTASVGWFDMKQAHGRRLRVADDPNEHTRLLDDHAGDDDGVGEVEGLMECVETEPTFENWFPGWGRWRFGMKLENAQLEFGPAEKWNIS